MDSNETKWQCDPKQYVNTILDFHKKWNSLALTVFKNDARLASLLDKSCRKLINTNIVTISSGNRFKSPELLAKFDDLTMEVSNEDLTVEVSKLRRKNSEEARNYQMALLELAVKENCIICLPTGSGKTFIARALCKEYLPGTMKRKQKIIFLAQTVALVKQQANYFKLELDSAVDKKSIVSEVTGEMNPDDWIEERWNAFMENCHVVFMTPDVLRKAAIKHSYIKFHQISLLIFDECHHAVKDNAMAVIMDEYTSKKSVEGYKLPRVVGLTATIIMGTSKCNKIYAEVAAIEKRMDCRAVTHANYADVLKYSTTFQETYVPYSCPVTDPDPTIAKINLIIDESIRRIENEVALIEDSRKTIVDAVNHDSLKSTSQLYNKEKKPSDELVKPLKAIKKQFDPEGMGLYAGKLTASLNRAYLKIKERNNVGELESLRIETISTVEKIIKICDDVMGPKPVDIRQFVSNKVNTLFTELENWNKSKGVKEQLCGIVFCKERITAQILSWIFKDAGETYPYLNFLKPHFVIGASRENNDMDELLVTLQKQQQTIERFRKKEFNLIFSTNVLEEGIDVPLCNFVLRFDSIQSYTSYVQSMGRARKEGAVYYILSKDGKELERVQSKVNGFKSFNVALSQYLQNGDHIIDESPSETAEEEESCCIDPNNTDSPKITLTAAVESVYQYCQTLSCDRYVSMDPWSWYEKVINPLNDKNTFVAYVQLPSNAIIRGIFKGQVMENSNKAKRSAFMEVCRQLYLNGAFDNNFFPVPRQLPENVTKLLEEVETDKFRDGNKVGTRKATKWYTKKIADCLINNPVEVGMQFSLYVVNLTVKSALESYSELYNFTRRPHVYGILSRTSLDKVPAFVLDSRHAKVVCSVDKVEFKGSTQLTTEEILKIHKFQDFLFFDTLNIPVDKSKSTVSNVMLVVPLLKEYENEWSINWQLMKKVDGTDLRIFTRGIDAQKRMPQIPVKDYDDAVVVPAYLEYSSVKDLKLFCSYKLRNDLHADSCMDERKSDSKTFREHYYSTYALHIEKSGPFLQCAQVGRNLNYMTLGEKYHKRSQNSQQIMIPEFVNIFPIPSSLVIQAQFLPSAIHRVMRLILSEQLRLSVARETSWQAAVESKACEDGEMVPSPPKRARFNSEVQYSEESIENVILKLDCTFADYIKVDETAAGTDGENEVSDNNAKQVIHVDYIHPNKITDIAIKNHQEWKFGNVKDTTLLPELSNITSYQFPELLILEDIKFPYPCLDTVTDLKVVVGPSCQEVMEALTLEKANDSVSLENLEVIGDSFLKIIVTIHIYCEFVDCDEGQLTQMRNKLISNSHLFSHGSKKEIGEYLSGGIFLPNLTWLPPYLQATDFIPRVITDDEGKTETLEEKQFKVNSSSSHSKLGDKDIADCVEALIGQYFLRGGTEGGLSLMSWMGLRGPTNEADKSVEYTKRKTPEIIYRNPESMQSKRPEEFLPYISKLEELIHYNFKNQWLVLEAFTHPSYFKNTLTDGYQRLEFLGDAVLDFLITNHICRTGSKRTPGELTDLRSALVNNITFGSLVVRYGIHHNLLCQSKPLSDAIDAFIVYQQQNGHAVTGHFTLLNDLECATDVEVPKILGDLFESLAGAVFLDSGMSFDTTWKVFYRLMKYDIDIFTANTPISPVRECYERQLKFVVDSGVTTPSLQGMTVVNIDYNGSTYSGCGRSVKQAKQAVAKYVLNSIKRDLIVSNEQSSTVNR